MTSNHGNFKFGMWAELVNSQFTDDKPSLKWAWSRHTIQFKFQGHNHISGITEARIVKFLTQAGYIKCYQKGDMSLPKWAWLWSRGRF